MDEDFETTTEIIRDARESDAESRNALPESLTSSVSTSSSAPVTSSGSTWNQAVTTLAKNADKAMDSARGAADQVHDSTVTAIDNARDKTQDVVDRYSTSSTTASTPHSTDSSSKGIIDTAHEAIQEMLHHNDATTNTTSSAIDAAIDKARDTVTHHDNAASKGVLEKFRDAAQSMFSDPHPTSSNTSPIAGPVSDIRNVLDPNYPKDTTRGVIEQGSKVDKGLMSSPWDEAVMRPSKDTLSVNNTLGTTTAYQFPAASQTTSTSTLSDNVHSASKPIVTPAEGVLDKLKHDAGDIAHDVHLNSQMAGLAIKSKVEDAQHQVSHQVDSLKHAFNDKFHK